MTDRAIWLEALVSANGAAHALLGLDARLLVVNQAFAAAFGRLPEEVEGRELTELDVPAAIVSQVGAQLRRVVLTGTPVSAFGLLPRGEMVLSPVRDADGVITAVAAIADTNAAALAAARAEAERVRQEAETGRTAIGRFLSAASHDLRQPFQAMHLFHHLLMGRLTDPGARDLGEKLEMSIEAAEGLLRALLDVSKLEAGLVRMQVQSFPIDETLGRLLNEFAPEADAKALRFNVRPADVEVSTDPVLLEQLLRPILSNALRFTESGGVLLAARRRAAHRGVGHRHRHRPRRPRGDLRRLPPARKPEPRPPARAWAGARHRAASGGAAGAARLAAFGARQGLRLRGGGPAGGGERRGTAGREQQRGVTGRGAAFPPFYRTNRERRPRLRSPTRPSAPRRASTERA
ncbi:sensor histidine kinase [Azospirillum brasilense]|uniref:sensor histidine kinase n=1 Tax=Azospirillum brasilense TaxID=192 RepID=UPI0026BE7126